MGVAILGVVGLVFGILLIVIGNAIAADAMDATRDEQFPTVISEGKTLLLDFQNPIDTSKEIKNSADAMKSARWASGKPVDITGRTMVNVRTPGGDQPVVSQMNDLTGEIILNSAEAGLGIANLVRILGIVAIILAVALTLAGVALHRVLGSITQGVGAAQRV